MRKERSCKGKKRKYYWLIIIVNLLQQIVQNNATNGSPLLDCTEDPVETNEYLSANMLGLESSTNRLSTMQPVMTTHANHQMMTENELVEISQPDLRMVLMNQTTQGAVRKLKECECYLLFV